MTNPEIFSNNLTEWVIYGILVLVFCQIIIVLIRAWRNKNAESEILEMEI